MNLTSIVFLVLLIAIVAVAVFLGIKLQKQTPTIVALQKDLEHAQVELTNTKEQAQARVREIQEQSEARLQSQREEQQRQYHDMLFQQNAAHKQALDSQRELFDKSIQEMKAEVKNTTEATLKQRQEEFAQTSGNKLEQILSPLKKELEDMQKSVSENSIEQAKMQSSMTTHINNLIQQSTLTAQSADALANALKNRGKVHGNWGEHVLEDILAESGLREGKEFTRQELVKDENDANRYPDVVVHFPEGKNLIIDSKTSLTAYTDALEAETEEARTEAMKRHSKSIKDHVKELTSKRYQNLVENAMPYVLMFIPNEGAYVMAMNDNPKILQEAYREGVIIVNPTNLMITLHLVLTAWQQTRQEDNCKQIIRLANSMYEKIVGVVDTFTTLGNQLHTAVGTYDQAMKQVSDGKGNLLHQAEGLKELGVTSTKKRKVQAKINASALPAETDGNVTENNNQEATEE